MRGMNDSYINWRKNQNVRLLNLANKERYYLDLMNIEHSWSGRMDTNIGNTFVMEAEQLLINAIELFELGYLDCAYYSLRSAVEISTTMVFLVDMPDEEKKSYLENWKNTKEFPMQGRMLKQLSQYGNVFTDMMAKMPHFFDNAKNLSKELNKYVHKQGLQHFYVVRNHPINQSKSQENFIKRFEEYLQRCIGIVAVMRLAIDPFPILLMDEEILYRCFDSMTEPYSEEFVTKYIGEETLNNYKETEIYIGTYEAFINDEKQNKSVFNVMKHKYIDSKRLDEIFSQLYLLSDSDIVSVLLVGACDKVVKVYCYNGFQMYFTDRNTKRTIMSWSGSDFKKFAEANELMNQVYDEAYISVFNFGTENYFVEHNEILDVDEISKMNEFVVCQLSKMEYGNK